MPYLSQCICWERKPLPPTPQMRRGTAIDRVVRKWVEQPKMDVGTAWSFAMELKEADMEAALWAKNAILELGGGKPVTTDKGACRFKLNLPVPNLILSGELDAFASGHVIDLKSGEKREYWSQMLPYAYYAFQQDPKLGAVDAHLVYCDQRSVETQTYTRNDTRGQLLKFSLACSNKYKSPTPGKCCSSCIHRGAAGCKYTPPS